MNMVKSLILTLKLFFINLIFGKRNKVITQIRAIWNNEPDDSVKPSEKLIASYFYYSSDESDRFVDDTVWYDLNLDILFDMMDRCVSSIGRQVLYKLMRSYTGSISELRKKFKQYDKYISNHKIREKIQYILFNLNDIKHCYLTDLLFDVNNAYNKGRIYVYISSLLLLITLILLPFIPVLFFLAIALMLHNMMLVWFFKRRVGIYFPGAKSLGVLLKTATKISVIKNADNLDVVSRIKEYKAEIDSLYSRLSWFLIDSSELDPMSAMFIDFLNLYFLADIISYCRAIEMVKSRQKQIQDIFELVGELDATISIASFISGKSTYCHPDFRSDAKINLTDSYHPLLDAPVSNSFTIDSRSALFTGSNMSGKTTFIRTVAINVLCGQTLGFCFAEHAEIPQVSVKTLIRREDDIVAGKSYYFKEVEDLLTLINKSGAAGRYLFVIDEIFRGTNTIERIASSAAVLEYLCENNIVMVTTHDLELQQILHDTYTMYHFSEQVEGENYYFDYKLQNGPCNSRNAIRLLELKGYPDSITTTARKLAIH